MTNLGLAIAERHERFHDSADLDAAMEAFEEAVDRTPGTSANWPRVLSNLGGGLIDRYHERGDPADLRRAIACFERALDGTALEWTSVAATSHNLGRALLDLYSRDGAGADLDRAVDALRTAVAVTPAGSQRLPGWLSSLATVLARRYEATGNDADRVAADEAAEHAVQFGGDVDLATAQRTAMEWGDRSARTGSWRAAADAFDLGIAILERLVRTQSHRQHKESWLCDADTLGPRAAQAAAMAGDLRTAVLGLERCRAVLLSEALDRDPATLRQLAVNGHPKLAAQFAAATDRVTALTRA
jgi:tetratricopeptide (TPR) repeat protein